MTADPFLKDLQANLDALISQYEGKRTKRTPAQKKLSRGKLYEFYALGKVASELRARGFMLALVGKVLDFKQSPGGILGSDTYLQVHHSRVPSAFRIYTDIEVKTIGSENTAICDLSHLHEIDIVGVEEGIYGNPHREDLLLAVECKSVAHFKKWIVKESLGVKREISFFTNVAEPSMLAAAAGSTIPAVASNPPLEFWLVYSDPAGDKYRESPRCFGIELKCWKP